jgi:fructose-1,6-bisphosphatase/inositol monophosphatase family enzyme
MSEARHLLDAILELHDEVRDEVVSATERQHLETLASVDRDHDGDTIYAIDVVGEEVVSRFAETLAATHSFVLIAEGLPGGRRCYQKRGGPAAPDGTVDEASVDWRIIIDPIDGTRGLMYQKRSAWVLTAVAPNRGPDTSLRDVVLAVQTEIPLVKQHLSDQLWALRGDGAQARRYNRLTGQSMPIRLTPSTATSIAHGYSSITRFFPGARDTLAALDEAVVFAALGAPTPGKASCFEDQYASTGGQLYELMAGHDRFVADLRPLVRPVLAHRGLPPSLTCHPYDVCCALIAEENGVIVTDVHGSPLDVPLNVDADVAWVGYANASIRAQIEPILQETLREHGLIGRHP